MQDSVKHGNLRKVCYTVSVKKEQSRGFNKIIQA